MTQLNPDRFPLQQFAIHPRQATFSRLAAGERRPGEAPLLAPITAACTLEPMTIAVLLVHGFGGDTDTWDTIAPQLGDAGLIVERLSLSGHGSDAAALATTPWTAWGGRGGCRFRPPRVCTGLPGRAAGGAGRR